MARPGRRSRFIECAVQHYVATASPAALQERLKQAAIRDRDLDHEIAGDWFAVDQEQWQRLDDQENDPPSNWPKKGEIYLTALDPTVGQIKKTRPALIIQNDTSKRYGVVTMAAPITSSVRLPLSPLHVLLPAAPATGLTVPPVAS